MITDVEQQTDIIMKQPIITSLNDVWRTPLIRPTVEVMKMLDADVLGINLCNDSQMVNDGGYKTDKNWKQFEHLEPSELIVLDSYLNLTKIRVSKSQKTQTTE